MPRNAAPLDWPKLLDEQRRSGDSLFAWCLARKLPLSTAYQWRRMLRDFAAHRGTEQSMAPPLNDALAVAIDAPSDEPQRAGFVRLHVASSPPPSKSSSSVLRVHVPGDRVIEVPDTFDEVHLQRVVLALEGLPCS